jgi:nitrite reductase/ring-hydroxylating ferredoxin subunit
MMGEDGPRAFFNVCRHLPVPLDGASGRPPIEDGDWICGTHGARFELTSGFCHAGPCRGSSLMALRLEVEDGVVFGWVNDDGGPLP